MISNHWIALRKESWSRLETLVQRVETASLRTLSSADLRDFGLLYRQAAADLSTVRTDEGSRTLEAYLNRLVSRAHNHIYSGDRMNFTTICGPSMACMNCGRAMVSNVPRSAPERKMARATVV
jgi:hypothetical protein